MILTFWNGDFKAFCLFPKLKKYIPLEMFVFVAETYGIYLNVLNVLSFVRKKMLKI